MKNTITEVYTYRLDEHIQAKIDEKRGVLELKITGRDLTEVFAYDLYKVTSTLELSDVERDILVSETLKAAHELLIIKKLRQAKV